MQTQSGFRPETNNDYEGTEHLESPSVVYSQLLMTPVLVQDNLPVPDSLTSGYSADFSSGESLSDTSSDTVVQETLFEAVHGQLFQDYDPWGLIKSRFSISCGEPQGESQLKAASTPFMELVLANDRTGVGYDLSQSLAVDCTTTALVLEPTEQEVDDPLIANTGSPEVDYIRFLTPTRGAEPTGPLCPHSPAESFMSLSISSNPGSAAVSPSRRSPTLSLLAFTYSNTASPDASTKTKDITASRAAEQKTFIQGPSLFFDNEDDEIE